MEYARFTITQHCDIYYRYPKTEKFIYTLEIEILISLRFGSEESVQLVLIVNSENSTILS